MDPQAPQKASASRPPPAQQGGNGESEEEQNFQTPELCTLEKMYQEYQFRPHSMFPYSSPYPSLQHSPPHQPPNAFPVEQMISRTPTPAENNANKEETRETMPNQPEWTKTTRNICKHPSQPPQIMVMYPPQPEFQARQTTINEPDWSPTPQVFKYTNTRLLSQNTEMQRNLPKHQNRIHFSNPQEIQNSQLSGMSSNHQHEIQQQQSWTYPLRKQGGNPFHHRYAEDGHPEQTYLR